MKKRPTILITAGPTREYIDPVRFISNDSSGTMGFALARAAWRAGCKVTLIAGPVSLKTPKGVERIDVISAVDMRKEVLKSAKASDVIIMAAAVADFAPLRFSPAKIKKVEGESVQTLRLKKNPDILKELCKARRKGQVIVGFALETHSLMENARKKLIAKDCDLIVANKSCAVGSQESCVTIITADGHAAKFPPMTKQRVARIILSYVL